MSSKPSILAGVSHRHSLAKITRSHHANQMRRLLHTSFDLSVEASEVSYRHQTEAKRFHTTRFEWPENVNQPQQSCQISCPKIFFYGSRSSYVTHTCKLLLSRHLSRSLRLNARNSRGGPKLITRNNSHSRETQEWASDKKVLALSLNHAHELSGKGKIQDGAQTSKS